MSFNVYIQYKVTKVTSVTRCVIDKTIVLINTLFVKTITALFLPTIHEVRVFVVV